MTVEGNVFVTTLDAVYNQATTVQQFNISYNGSIASLASEGLGYGSLSTDTQLVYDILHNHAYIAMDTSLLVVNLNISNPPLISYDTLDVGHTPTAIKAFTLSDGDPFVVVSYTTDNNREYAKRFRKYENQIWGFYGEPVLVVTPYWYNLTIISNTLIYKAAESFSTSLQTIWAAVAQEWYIYVQDLIDGTTRTFLVPEPCDNVQRLVHSEHRQRMLVQCAEATVFFDSNEKQFFHLWSDVIGTVFIAANGEYGVVVNTSGVGLTVLNLNLGYQSLSVSVEGLVQDVVFVDAGSSLHYLCYVEQFNEEFAVKCANIEQLNSTQNSALLYQGIAEVPPTLYTNKNLLTVQHSAAENCLPLMQVFDMITLVNTHNITNINPTLIAFRPLPLPPAEITTDDTITTTTLSEPPASHAPHTTHTIITETTATDPLAHCTVELDRAQEDYQQLLLATAIVSSLFCIILLVTVIVLAIVLYYARAHSSNTTKSSRNEPPVLTDMKKN